MKYIFKKYEFESQDLAETRIAALPHTKDEDGNSYPSHSHTVVKLGKVVVEQGTYDEEGNELTAPIFADMYSIDVLWNASEITETDEDGNKDINYPYGWVSKEIEVEGNGVHTFFGINYSEK
jgi:hypothetical protein